jgi:hypothetical protein
MIIMINPLLCIQALFRFLYLQTPNLKNIQTLATAAGMAAMMFPAIIPMILVYNRLIGDSNNRNSANNNQNNQLLPLLRQIGKDYSMMKAKETRKNDLTFTLKVNCYVDHITELDIICKAMKYANVFLYPVRLITSLELIKAK